MLQMFLSWGIKNGKGLGLNREYLLGTPTIIFNPKYIQCNRQRAGILGGRWLGGRVPRNSIHNGLFSIDAESQLLHRSDGGDAGPPPALQTSAFFLLTSKWTLLSSATADPLDYLIKTNEKQAKKDKGKKAKRTGSLLLYCYISFSLVSTSLWTVV